MLFDALSNLADSTQCGNVQTDQAHFTQSLQSIFARSSGVQESCTRCVEAIDRLGHADQRLNQDLLANRRRSVGDIDDRVTNIFNELFRIVEETLERTREGTVARGR